MTDRRLMRCLAAWPCVLTIALLPAAVARGELRADSGTLTFSNELYRVVFDARGGWRSFSVAGEQMLGEAGEAFLDAPAMERVDERTIRGEAGSRFMEARFDDTSFEIEVRDDAQTSAQAMSWTLDEGVTWAVFPREHGKTVSVPVEHRQDKSAGGRFITAAGPAFETDHRTWLDHRDGGRTWGTFRYPQGLTMTFRPLREPRPTDLLKLELVDRPANNFFDEPQITLAFEATHHGATPIDVELRLSLLTYTPNQGSDVLQQRRAAATIAPRSTRRFEATFDEVAAGPYEFTAAAEHAGGSRVELSGALLHRREAWHGSLPDLEPADFDAFWQETLTQLRSRSLEAEIREPTDRRGVPDEFKLVSFNGLGDSRVRGFLAMPPGASADNPVPARLGLPGAGYGAAPLSREDYYRGWAYLSLSIHDLPFGGESGRHHPREYWSQEPYQGLGREHRDSFFYRRAYANSVRAVDFLASLPEVDAERIVVSGGSQGGSLAIAVAALDPRVALAVADIPGRVRWDLLTWAYRANCSFQPPDGLTPREMFDRTLAYHDIAYLARRVQSPTLVVMSMGDEINPGPLQWIAYRELPESIDKRLRVAPLAGHGGGPYDGPDPLPQMYDRYVTDRP